jgi:hypothetical protein
VVNTVEEQVSLLIQQATALEHLSTAFVGWCAFCGSFAVGMTTLTSLAG